MNKNRIEAFSDGVFAIVITLLILDIRIPEIEYQHLPDALIAILPRIAAYVMTFTIIGVYWVGHHQSFQLVAKTDGIFLWLNTLFLLFISFLPFPTSLLGRYPMQSLPILLYGANLLAANASAFVMLWYLKRHPALSAHTNMQEHISRHYPLYITVNVSYLIAILMGFIFPIVSYFIYFFILILLIFFYGKYRIPQ